ncbi:glucose-methanol-choline oxidoreductase, FAD/NAD(P)-binding domain protein [Artemisia annua]|uniref:Glucose-methanol-choline oxidoreductase, FAD/NAD(P)-binding domain protein n=1 Tax=Artemisia annua TaxID=35608 RepID=A0A2U1P542_ARTAN|nr:glucose-methanol-choline oxidoreductase, FAD/NAD(P)-binding domain protein [Artemisia annua]
MGAFCRRTIWHYHGGCLVDSELRVLGVGSLGVIDGSVLSISLGTNPQATVLMRGRSDHLSFHFANLKECLISVISQGEVSATAVNSPKRTHMTSEVVGDGGSMVSLTEVAGSGGGVVAGGGIGVSGTVFICWGLIFAFGLLGGRWKREKRV